MVEDFLQFFINRLLEQTESIFFVQTETRRLFLLSNDLHEEIKELSRVAMVKKLNTIFRFSLNLEPLEPLISECEIIKRTQ